MSSMGGMAMGSMSMGNGVPSLFTMQQMYWAVVGSAIGTAAVVNALNRCLARQRLQDKSQTPARPKSLFLSFYATITAITREISYATIPPISLGGLVVHFPPLGPVLIVLANLITILALCFYGLDTSDVWQWENIGYRTGFIAICQLPLIFLLAGRQNIIGYLTDMSYARLNWFHRWAARTLWLTATIHMGFWFNNWGRYDYILHQLTQDPLTKRGFSAWCILTFIVISSLAPVRKLSYEIFVIQHIITFVGFIVAIWMHALDEVKIWVWIPIGLVVFDRLVRYLWAAYTNIGIFHPKYARGGSILAHSTTLVPVLEGVTRVTIHNPGISWRPGQHVFLSFPTIAPLQSHPFTISSLPEDNKMEFYIRAKNGATKHLLDKASKKDTIATSKSDDHLAFIEGPYGNHRPLRQFDTVVLLAGGVGVTFTMPLLRDIVSGWKRDNTVTKTKHHHRSTATKHVRFVWVIKSRAEMSIFESQIQDVLSNVAEMQNTNADFEGKLDIGIYLTCDENLDSVSRPAISFSAKNASTTPSNEERRTASPNKKCQGEKCCCRERIQDEISTAPCCCAGPMEEKDIDFDPDLSDAHSSREIPTGISMTPEFLTGRPHPRDLIRKSLEKAQGESAVVICGPAGLADDVRRSVVYLSDERAVHKGTGAQGIYLHVENFGY